MKIASLRTGIMVIMLLLITIPAVAAEQENDQPKANEPYILPEITVSAQKIEQRLQDVPISIRHYSDIELENKQVESVKDIVRVTPNLFMNEAPGNDATSAITIRGISSGNSDFFNRTVGIFSNGMAINGGLLPEFFDIESVDVLRGPQGTLYGGNTLGGAISVNAKKPQFDWGTYASAAYESYNTSILEGMINAPLSEHVAVRVAGKYKYTEGQFENVYRDAKGTQGHDFNLRGQLLIQPTDKLKINLNLNGYERDHRYSIYDTFANLDDHPWKTHQDDLGYVLSRDFGQILTVEYSGDVIGFTSISGHRNYASRERQDVDFTRYELLSDNFKLDNEQFSQEFRLHSTDKEARLQWVAGVYGAKEKQRTRDSFTLLDDYVTMMAGMPGFGSVTMDNDTRITVYNGALFGQATYGLTDKLYATAGLRYDYTRKKLDAKAENRGMLAPMLGPLFAATDGTRSFNALLPKFALEYRFTPQINVYASVTEGYKAGGFQNVNAAYADQSYNSEYDWSYETGVKASFWDGKVDLAASLFYVRIKDQHLYTQTATSYLITNAGKSHSEGIEIEGKIRPIHGLEIFGAYGYTKARIDDAGDNTNTFDGAIPTFVPTYTADLGAQYTFDNGFFLRLENSFIGPYYMDTANKVRQSSFSLLHAKIGYETENMAVYIYGRNLLNQEYKTHYFDNSSMMPGQDRIGTMGPGRTIGVMAKVEF
jgi:iron complex outermembrane receptor protein